MQSNNNDEQSDESSTSLLTEWQFDQTLKKLKEDDIRSNASADEDIAEIFKKRERSKSKNSRRSHRRRRVDSASNNNKSLDGDILLVGEFIDLTKSSSVIDLIED